MIPLSRIVCMVARVAIRPRSVRTVYDDDPIRVTLLGVSILDEFFNAVLEKSPNVVVVVTDHLGTVISSCIAFFIVGMGSAARDDRRQGGATVTGGADVGGCCGAAAGKCWQPRGNLPRIARCAGFCVSRAPWVCHDDKLCLIFRAHGELECRAERWLTGRVRCVLSVFLRWWRFCALAVDSKRRERLPTRGCRHRADQHRQCLADATVASRHWAVPELHEALPHDVVVAVPWVGVRPRYRRGSFHPDGRCRPHEPVD